MPMTKEQRFSVTCITALSDSVDISDVFQDSDNLMEFLIALGHLLPLLWQTPSMTNLMGLSWQQQQPVWPLVWKTWKCHGIWNMSRKCQGKNLVREKCPKTV